LIASPRFQSELVAGPSHIDLLGHVSNIVYVEWLQAVAAAHSAAVGWDQAAYRELGAVFVVRRHEIDYRAPAFAGDRILLETWVEWWRPASSLRRTTVRRADGALLAEAATTWAFVGITDGRPRRIPPEVSAAFSPAATPP
jgi:acyl-CoA thioester hydrolase